MAATGFTGGDPNKVSTAGDTMTGDLVLPQDPDADLEAATKQYVDNTVVAVSGTYVNTAGDTMTGLLILSADPSAALGAATKQYVDNSSDAVSGAADAKFATIIVVSGLSGDVTTLDGFVQDALTRIAAVENGTAFLSALNVAGDAQIAEGNLTVTDFTKGYRFRIDGSALDLEATGVDLLISNWSGSGFNGTQRSYDRYSADTDNVQHAGKREWVDALYGATRHVVEDNTGIAAWGSKNGLTNIRLAGFKDSAGAPAAGDWLVGDVVLDSAGAWHLCTASGTPGSWT